MFSRKLSALGFRGLNEHSFADYFLVTEAFSKKGSQRMILVSIQAGTWHGFQDGRLSVSSKDEGFGDFACMALTTALEAPREASRSRVEPNGFVEQHDENPSSETLTV